MQKRAFIEASKNGHNAILEAIDGGHIDKVNEQLNYTMGVFGTLLGRISPWSYAPLSFNYKI